MMERDVIRVLGEALVGTYNSVLAVLPPWLQTCVNLFLIVAAIVIYAILIWHFYRFVAKKNFIGLNLEKYSQSEHPLLRKIVAACLYLIEYILILPIFIFVWFSLFTLFLVFLTNEMSIGTILLSSTIITAVIRATSYYKEDLSRDLAKLLPLTLIAVMITQFGSFSFAKILSHFSAVPNFISQIGVYLLFILLLEVLLRFIDLIFRIAGIEKEEDA